MRPMILTRIHRRCIVKYFGSCRNLMIWVSSVLFTVFLLDSYVLNGGTMKRKKPLDEASGEYKSLNDEVHSRNTSCGQSTPCSLGQYSYLLRSGSGANGQPTVCFDGHVIFSPEKKNGKRGISLARINGKTMNVDDVRTFDTHENDEILQRYLKLGVEREDLILLSTVTEASLHLSSTTKELLQSFGSAYINDLEFRDAFVMIGQQNLAPPSKAIEQLIKRKDGEVYAGEASVEGCLSNPLGNIRVENNGTRIQAKKINEAQIEDKVKLGDYWINCGLPERCPDDSFPVNIHTGNKNVELPKVCFRGRNVIARELNNPGRGIAVVVIDPNSGAILKAERFDTYESAANTKNLEEFLVALKSDEMIIAVAHDEAKTALSDRAVELLISFGSNFIKDLGFRDVWAFVGRAGLDGFSPYEDIEPAGKDSWPYPISWKFCIKKNFMGQKDRLDLKMRKNIPRREFCKTYDGYEDFCSIGNVDGHPKPLPSPNKTLEGTEIYKVPVVLVPGLSQVSVVQQLEALFKIPGIDIGRVVMMCDEKFVEARNIASLFNVTVRQLKSSTKYISLMHDAMEQVWNMFTDADYSIILEEEVIPTPDLLVYFGQCLEVLGRDDTLAGASAFNEHGFEGHSIRPDLVYRGETFPGTGFLLKKSFYLRHMAGNLQECCSVRSWFGWRLPPNVEMLIPDVSRTIRRVYLGLTEHAEFIREYFNKPREYSKAKPTKMTGISSLTESNYKEVIEKLIKSASGIPKKSLDDCVKIPGLKLDSKTYAVYFNQARGNQTLLGLSRCFNLLSNPKFTVRGMHKNTLRFTYYQAEVILVGEKSPYFGLKPRSEKLFTS